MSSRRTATLLRHPGVQAAVLVWIGWLAWMVWTDGWALFAEGWFMTVTMVFGSMIAGATSEGGGAVAFPVMTLAFDVAPSTARDFSLMIQSFGMMAAAWTIWRSGIPFDRRAVLWAGVGGGVGIILGLTFVAPRIAPAQAKLFFVSLWLSFGVALVWLNCRPDRSLHDALPEGGARVRVLLVAVGILGGAVSAVTGSGLDIVTFSLLVLTWRLNEKIATPTTVILMGCNALVGFAWRLLGPGEPIPAEAWTYLQVCIPVVVIGAPVGTWLAARSPRLLVVAILCASILVQFEAALLIIPLDPERILVICGSLAMGLSVFGMMAWAGRGSAARPPGTEREAS